MPETSQWTSGRRLTVTRDEVNCRNHRSFPVWFPIFLETCHWNPTIQWIVHTDALDSAQIKNVQIRHLSADGFVRRARDVLGIDFILESNYKLCDLRPTYGVLYEPEISGFDFFGYGDLDVLYGDIRAFYDDRVLEKDIVSNHTWCIFGHFALFRNADWLRNAYKKVPDWKSVLEDPMPRRFAEDLFSQFFRMPRNLKHLYWKEQFTTPLTKRRWIDGSFEHPQTWYWNRGKVTNCKDHGRDFPYLHFMNYVSARHMNPAYGDSAPWSGLNNIIHVEPAEIHNGIRVDSTGFHRLRGDS